MLSIFLNILTFVIVIVLCAYYSRVEQKEQEELETTVPLMGKIVLKKEGEVMYSVPYEGIKDFEHVHNAVFVQLLQRKKEGGDWVIEVIPL